MENLHIQWAISFLNNHGYHSVLIEYRLIKSVDPKLFSALHRQGRLANNLR